MCSSDLGPERQVLWHPRFLDFARHYGFEPFACRPRDPDRKGKKEKSFRLVHDDFIKGTDFESWDELDARRRIWLDETPGVGNLRVPGTTSRVCVLTVDMLEDLHSSAADRSFARALRRYVKPQVLLLDEFGHAGPFDAIATHYLFRVISARHQQGAIVITANTGFSKWKSLFPSEETAVATVDRLVDRATILRFTGKSLRDPLLITGAPLED